MAINYPIIETQMRLIRALQKGYVEALEAGDWQAADYRCAHLNKLCEGLHHLSQLLNTENSLPNAVTPKNVNHVNSWVSSVHGKPPAQALTASSDNANKSSIQQPLPPEQVRNEWGIGFQGIEPPPIDEVW